MLLFTKTGNSIERVVRTYYPAYPTLSLIRQREVVNYAIQYMFKHISAAQFTSLFREAVGNKNFRVIELRRTLVNKGYYVKNLKLWLYYWYKTKTPVNAKALKSFHIREEDSTLHRTLNTDSLDMFETIAKKGYKEKTILEFDQAVERQIHETATFIRKFVYRKMRFIFEMHGMDPDDICKKLTADGLQAVMFTYPRIETTEHLANILKRTAHNSGVNFIETYTTKGRARLRSNTKVNEDSRVVVPLSSPEVQAFLSADENGTLIDGTTTDTMTVKLSVSRKTSKYRGRKRRFLSLISGEYDAEFSDYLKKNKLRYDNDDLFGKVEFKAYMNYALAFLNVPSHQGIKFVETLKTKLASLRDEAA